MNTVDRKIYLDQLSLINHELAKLRKSDARLALLRLSTALIGLGIVIFSFSHYVVFGFLSTFVVGLLFFLIYVKHESIKERIEHRKTLIIINENEISCIDKHENLYYHGEHFSDSRHHFTNDLDIFGDYSLFGLINRCKTFYGNQILASYFTNLKSLPHILEKRQAVKELTEKMEWRHNFQSLLLNLQENPDENFSENLLNELDNDFSFFDGNFWKVALFMAPVIWILILISSLFRMPFMDSAAIAFGLIILIIYYYYIKKINKIQFTISRGNEMLSVYGEAFKEVYYSNWNAPYLKRITDRGQGQEVAIGSMFQLRKIMDKLDYRLNMIAGIFLNLFMLWDFRIVRQLSKWKEKNYNVISQLFITLGKMEALSSLANWAFNNPEFTYSYISDSGFNVKAYEVSHPLMMPGECVPNDFIAEEKNIINIITGSNMSGKSTFLRTIGTNMILAYAGTVSAAKEMSIPLVNIITYMRIKDALEENVSTFKAELDRVKLILNAIKSGDKYLFIIDEMLRGTNSNDKLKGSMAIVRTLLDNRSHAIIATHDIKLAEMSSDYPEHIKNYYFDITFYNEELRFDYLLKEGICSNFNASYLLEKIGIK